MLAAGQIAVNARLKRRAALASVAASVLMTLVKFAAGAMSGSLALLSEAAHNGLDVAASGLTYYAVREADRPADDDHHFGHAKIEAVVALFQTGFLFVLAAAVAFAALRRIGGEAETVDANAFAFAAIVISIVIDIVRWRTLTIVAARTGSDALAADALHFSSDLVASVLVLAGLAATRAGLPHADALAAAGVALFIGVAGFRLGRRTVDALLDAAPKGMAQSLRRAVEQVPGVAGTDFVRLRRSGAKVVGDLGLHVSRTLPLERVAALKADVQTAIHASLPNVEVTLTANPVTLDDETLIERILLIAGRRRLFVHHLGVQNVGERKSVTLDLEVDGGMRFADAHDIASQLEAAIAAELGADIEVETHIEPMEIRELGGEPADPALVERISAALSQAAARGGALSDIHDVRVWAGPAGHYVIFHCHADSNFTVAATHDQVDALERALRDRFPEVIRIVSHAEPAH